MAEQYSYPIMNRLIPLLLLFFSLTLSANNVAIANVEVAADGPYARVTFDLSWDNAWRRTAAPANWDAVWVFAKFRVDRGPWRHATLQGVAAAPAGAQIDVLDRKGAMVYPAAPMSGTASFPGLALAWDFHADGFAGSGDLDFRVLGIEMVYVPEDPFYLGSGPALLEGESNETDEFYAGGSLTKQPYYVDTEAAIPVGNVAGGLYFEDSYAPDGVATYRPALRSGTIPADFPKGYRAFYCMKHEVSQELWAEFMNTLTRTQQDARDNFDDVMNPDGDRWRNGYFLYNLGSDPGIASTNRPNLPAGHMSMYDMWALLDWAALRPMSELEFEKAMRGPEYPLNNEFAWGAPGLFSAPLQLSSIGLGTEAIMSIDLTGLLGNAALGTLDDAVTKVAGPLRCGIYAGSHALNNRLASGATYYGIMEMSGNQWEALVTVTSTDGRRFTNEHGDGTLDAAGYADTATWPATREGFGFRGGRIDNSVSFGAVADRTYTNLQISTVNTRYSWLQARGVRGL